MPKTFALSAAVILAGSLLPPALAGATEALSPDRAILLADASGLVIRLKASDACHPSRAGNPIGAVINTAGVARASVAMVVDGRVYLAAGPSVPAVNAPAGEVAAATPQTPQAAPRL